MSDEPEQYQKRYRFGRIRSPLERQEAKRETQTGVEIKLCATCQKEHPESRQHCHLCGVASAFIQVDGFCLNHYAISAPSDCASSTNNQ